VILRSLLSNEDHGRLVWVSPSPETLRSPGRVVHLDAGWHSLRGKRSLLLDSTVLAHALARETLRTACAQRARAIWVVLHGAGVPVAAELVKRDVLPVHVTVHDDPTFGVALRSRRYVALSPWIELCLARALTGARSVDVISEGMRRRYQRKFGVGPIVVHRAMPGPVAPSPPFESEFGLRIGVLGNTYSYAQLPVLARTVAEAARAVGVQGKLTFVGRGHAARLRRELGRRSELVIDETGHVGERDAVDVLRKCFALYLNYPFGWRDAVLRQTSFPTKLSTYVLAARPLLLHTAPDATLKPLAADPGYAIVWESMEEAVGVRLLVEAWRDARMHRSMHVAAEAIRVRYFDPVRNRRALLGALNALVEPPEEELRMP
jgi:hypothetical protein